MFYNYFKLNEKRQHLISKEKLNANVHYNFYLQNLLLKRKEHLTFRTSKKKIVNLQNIFYNYFCFFDVLANIILNRF